MKFEKVTTHWSIGTPPPHTKGEFGLSCRDDLMPASKYVHLASVEDVVQPVG